VPSTHPRTVPVQSENGNENIAAAAALPRNFVVKSAEKYKGGAIKVCRQLKT
jgi:hypothetical protein